jgi:hypothetical protein
MRLDAGVRRQSTRVTIINGPTTSPRPSVGWSLPRCRTRSTFVESGSPLAWARTRFVLRAFGRVVEGVDQEVPTEVGTSCLKSAGAGIDSRPHCSVG